ncbi:hypothetical protein D5086_032758 [Populus alba]|uniref:Uncharacterized protein n=1 Tax=Populus alba TaxID=43335 RepID=A0ACC4AFQ7_POPAL
MGAKLVQLNNQRRSVTIEGIVSEFQRGMKSSNIYTDIDSEEGAKIFKILETSAEREVLMAEMSPQQLASFASYQSKLEATRQLDMEKAIGKALQDAGLGEREVTEKGLVNKHFFHPYWRYKAIAVFFWGRISSSKISAEVVRALSALCPVLAFFVADSDVHSFPGAWEPPV